MNPRRQVGSILVGIALCACAGRFSSALGQAPIVDDGSLGLNGGDLAINNNTLSIPENLGQTVGNNLFHSFSRFNVPGGVTAAFDGASSIQNVITRVSGTEASVIDGAIDTRAAMPSANFFLLNPNGIHFGQDATLNVGGAVAISTGDELGFADGKTFPASIPVSDVLSSASVDSFGFTSPQPMDISMNGTAIAPGGGNLSLIGGDVRLNGTFLEPPVMNVVAMGDAPADAGPRQVKLDPTDRDSIPQVSDANGEFAIDDHRSFTFVSRVFAGMMNIARSFMIGSDRDATGFGLTLNATKDILAVDSLLTVDIGNLQMDANNINLIRGDDDVQIFPGGGVFIEVSSASLALLGRSQEKAGDLYVNARGDLSLEGYAIISTADGDNSAGSVNVNVGGTLRISESTSSKPDLGEITSLAAHGGSPGNIEEKVGDINVTANRIEMVGAAEIGSASVLDIFNSPQPPNRDFAPAGNVSVVARESITIDAAKPANMRSDGIQTATPGIFSQFSGTEKGLENFMEGAVGQAVGDAGDVTIRVQGEGRLELRNGARISSSGSRLESSAGSPSDAGVIDIEAGSVFINGPESGIFAESFLQTGQTAGGINVRNARLISLLNDGQISSESRFQLAGDIRLSNFQPNAEVRLQEGVIKTVSGGDGAAGGDIFIGIPEFLILQDSEINSSATGTGGRGGNILLNSRVLLLDNSILDASASSGVSGAVSGADIPVNLSDVVSPVSAVPVGDSLKLPEQSAVFQSQDISGHAILGRGRRPRVPEKWQLNFEDGKARRE